MAIERTIQKAKIRETGMVIDTNAYFKDRHNSHEIREEYNKGKINFICLNCDQKLELSKSRHHNIYLKHFPKSDFCELKDEKLSNNELEVFNTILVSKESKRHIFLKNRIGELLKKEKNISNVRVDDHFIFDNKGKKRRPDVYCKYLDKEIVFEIQLSKLSQKYILGRYDFYRAKDIYLIWVLDNFDVRGNTAIELDIKYLSKHQNYFRFIDEVNQFKLKCEYKYTYLDPASNTFHDKWNEVLIGLDKLNFDITNIEVYFHNFQKEKEQLELLRKKNSELIEEKKKEQEEKKEYDRALYKVQEFLENIAVEKRKKFNSNFYRLEIQLKEFSETELIILNNRLDLNNSNRVFNWVNKVGNKEQNFLEFILKLSPLYVEFDINGLDNNGNSIFYHLFTNKDIPYIHNKEEFLKIFFGKKYKFNKNDETILKSYLTDINLYDSFAEYKTLFTVANNTPKWLMDKLFESRTRKIILIIESFLQKTLIGYHYPNNEWLNLAQNSIEHYPKYWTYILSAIKYSKLYDLILSNDKRGGFKKKIASFSSADNTEDKDFNQLFMNLYPELINI